MTADIKPFVSSVKQTYMTRSNALKHSMYGNTYEESFRLANKPPINSNGLSSRIKSAIHADPERSGTSDRASKSQNASYTRFRPITSHPTTSLLASLYKQQSFAESRNAQAASKLPSILYNRSLMQSSKSSREIKPFSSPTYSTSSPHVSGNANVKKGWNANEKNLNRTINDRQEHNDRPATVNASATWAAVHDSILASGQGIFHNAPQNTSSHSISKNKSSDAKTPLSRSSVNYVPFYEIRGRGDGASVIDIPSIDVEGKKIEKHFVDPMANKHKYTPAIIHPQHLQSALKSSGDEGNISKKSDDQSSVKITESYDGAPDSLVSSSFRAAGYETNKLPSASKVEKKVRFSGTVTTNKISDEPSYTEALINSLHKSFKQHNYLNTAHKTVAATLGENMDLRNSEARRSENESLDASSKATGEEDYPPFITPVMKVVVTKRETPAGAENLQSNLSSPRDFQQHLTPQQVSNAASRIIGNQVPTAEKGTQSRPATRPLTTAEVLRRGTQATQRASTAGYGRNKEAIARVVKLVPKRQTVIMPNFTKQPAWPASGKAFTRSGRSYEIANSTANSPAFSASVHGNNFTQQLSSAKEKSSTQAKETLRSRLMGSVQSRYFGRAEPRQTKFSRMSTDAQKKSMAGELEATPIVALPTTENVSQVAMLSSRLFTDFQPIPSMPDHINFCDPRKTELILHWLEDVNKKRNIESRLRRVGFQK